MQAAKRAVLDHPGMTEIVLGLVLQPGMTDVSVAAALPIPGVSRQAIHLWRKRHREEFEAARLEAAARTTEVAVTQKVERVRRLAGLYDEMQEIVSNRGLMASEAKWIGDGKVGREIEVQRFDGGLVKEMRGTLRDVAEELGQVPRPDVGAVERTFVLIRERIIERGEHLEPLG